MKTIYLPRILARAALLIVSWMPGLALAHCDSMDGPVVTEARAALEKGDVTPLLKWVQPEHESEIRAAFQRTLTVRGRSPEARELADMYFFETLVRVHRAGEGAPYTGLRPAGQQEPIVFHSDQALDKGAAEDLIKDVTEAVKKGIDERFHHALEARVHASHSVEAGRAYVAAYVEYMHFVERLYHDATMSAAHHAEAPPIPPRQPGGTRDNHH